MPILFLKQSIVPFYVIITVWISLIPGRMGMLIMLYLIQINTYSSSKAPPHRGFSSIEVWFLAMQAPIVIAILEYGFLLAVKKFWPNNVEVKLKIFVSNKESLFKHIDFFTFIMSSLYFMVFNLYYWFPSESNWCLIL